MTAVRHDVASPTEGADALRNLPDADLRRLERIARLRCVGLHDLHWRDLLHDAIARLLDGSRIWPKDLSLVVFLRETMRSIASDHWRRRNINPVQLEADLPERADSDNFPMLENAPDLTPSPEEALSTVETLARIQEIFREDAEALHVIIGMASGQSPGEIQRGARMTPTRYTTTQRRIRRTLAREFPDRGGQK